MSYADFISDLSDGQGELLDEVGESVTYDQPPVEPFALSVTWNGADNQPDGLNAWCKLDDFPLLESGERMEPRKGDRITRGNYTYRLTRQPLRDGTGGATLYVELTGRVTY